MNFQNFLQIQEIIILSGGMGSELYRRGYKTKIPLWSAGANLACPELVQQIHLDYINAGADIITTNTFRTQPYTFAKVQQPKETAQKATENAVNAALEAKNEVGKKIYVGGGLASLEDCYEPEKTPDNSILYEEHSFQTNLLAKLGVDFLFCETIGTIKEAKVLAQCCNNTGLPFFISFITNQAGNLLSGESLKDAIQTVKAYSPFAILLNCRPSKILAPGMDILIEAYDCIKGVYANGEGIPDNNIGWEFIKNNDIKTFLQYAKKWFEKGVKILGGCCGTNPDYIKKLVFLKEKISLIKNLDFDKSI